MAPLQDQLDEIMARTRELVQPDKLAASEQLIAELFVSGIEDKILPVGAQAPSFELVESTGRVARSEDLLALGPLVVKFFRGRWCPYCVTEMEAWEKLYPELRERNALLVAISPQLPRQNDFMAGRHGLPFALLSDPGCTLAKQFGLVYTIPESMRDYYQSLYIDLEFINGESSWKLPLPATYLIGQDSKVLYAEAYADFRVRPEPAEVLAALDLALGR
ncbi:peroxiredoxin-like family protein [Telmatobacter bradus]|uniref:peroxiredoxin-like family protein n=1 Tax=Telmatobacter bradus TaxID=474953 RepID=UPI003B43B478